MRRRLPTLLLGTALGFLLAGTAAHFALSWGLLPNRELNRSADYVKEVLRTVNENHVDADAAGYTRLTREALHGIVGSLDPHSEFLEARDFQALDDEMRGDFGGIGIQIENRGNHIVIITAIADTPAERAGIRRGDEILSVDGSRVGTDMQVDDIVDKLRGNPGTKVLLKLHRSNPDKDIEITIVRERIKVKSVREVSVIAEGVGYIQLAEFSETTGDEFHAALDGLLKQGIHSLVLDLRNNPGGLLDAAVWVAEPFYKRGELVVYTQGRRPADREDFRSEIDGPPLSMPIAVLINAGSASAAEIVAGTLKDTGRAVIVGERSFGKGSVQTIFKLRNGEGMRLTTARYYTPSGQTIHGKGVSPQVEVIMTPEEDEHLRVQRTRTDLQDPVAFEARFGYPPVRDRQLDAALDSLRGLRLLLQRGLDPDRKP